jgi:hypothetical protein
MNPTVGPRETKRPTKFQSAHLPMEDAVASSNYHIFSLRLFGVPNGAQKDVHIVPLVSQLLHTSSPLLSATLKTEPIFFWVLSFDSDSNCFKFMEKIPKIKEYHFLIDGQRWKVPLRCQRMEDPFLYEYSSAILFYYPKLSLDCQWKDLLRHAFL